MQTTRQFVYFNLQQDERKKKKVVTTATMFCLSSHPLHRKVFMQQLPAVISALEVGVRTIRVSQCTCSMTLFICGQVHGDIMSHSNVVGFHRPPPLPVW